MSPSDTKTLIRIFATVASSKNTNFPAFCSQSSGDEFDERGFPVPPVVMLPMLIAGLAVLNFEKPR